MPVLKDMEIGAMFWAGKDPRETLKQVESIGVRCGQVGVGGDIALDGAYIAAWRAALAAEPGHEGAAGNLINLLYGQGRIPEARAELEKAEARRVAVHPGLKKAVLAAGK